MKNITMPASKSAWPIPRLAIASLGAAAGALAMVLALTQCAPPAAAQVAVDSSRIVAAGGAVTEVLYALGLQAKIVGVDSTSQFPDQAQKDKANVGYVRALSVEGVLSLKPSLVIAIPDSGPPDALKLIGEAGVPMRKVPDEASADGVGAKIRAIGLLAGASDKAEALASDVGLRFAALADERAKLGPVRRVLFVLALQNGRPMVGGRATAADAIIALAGGVNAASEIEGYKPMTDEAIIAAAPDVILMMNRGNHAASAADVFGLPAFSATPAAASQALVVMDGMYLLGFGPRTPEAARDLMAALYPDKRAALQGLAK